ncbi:MAG: FumA C-terminus/TtdB family hydratase beta subunit [Candidatus Margulisiibacteriota bacterium]|nr:FumA C-terminus/TtdB family hydratase beta subunit [Candidatus Margulisiibacteriota bacterium]
MPKSKSKLIKLKAPLTDKDVKSLKAGDKVLISGIIYTARDAAHRIFQNKPPFKTEGAILYYASPTPTPKGKIIGSIGPTTSTRMDPFTPALLKQGVKITIGKGRRGKEVITAMKKYKAAYMVVPGGTAALMSRHIKKSTVIAYPDLGSEAILALDVVDFPAIVAIDSKGKDLFEQGRKKYASK